MSAMRSSDQSRSMHRCANHQRRAQTYLRCRALLGDAADIDLPPADLCPYDVEPIRSTQSDRGARLRRRRFHRQAAFGRGALCAVPRRRADSRYAARFDPARHHRSPDRFEQQARFLRARYGGLRARGSPDGSLSAIILDIDNFKHINDSYGHEIGDEAICCCARAAFLTEAVVGRLGGDEFALLLEDRTLPQAIEIAENLRSRLAAQPFDTGKDRITLTWSVGVSEGRPGDSVDQILTRADAALYDAKLGGGTPG